MVVNMIEGLYPDFVGRRQIFAGSGNGPVSYNTTTNDVVTLSNPRLYVDVLFGGGMTVSGTYYVLAQSTGVGARQTWSLVWRVTSTNAEVGNGINLSAEQIQVGGFCGQF